jgi:hypothetical protein
MNDLGRRLLRDKRELQVVDDTIDNRVLREEGEVLRLLVGKGLLSPEWAGRILSWRHTGFNVHSRVRARTKTEAERVGKYMLRPILALERLTLLEAEGKVGNRHGEKGAELETMDYLEFLARVTSHIPDKGQVMVRYFGLYANAHRGLRAVARTGQSALFIFGEDFPARREV